MADALGRNGRRHKPIAIEHMQGATPPMQGAAPPSPPMDNLTLYKACVLAGFRVSSQLTSIDGNTFHATNYFYFTVLYAAIVVNEMGPENPITVLYTVPELEDQIRRNHGSRFHLAKAVRCMRK